VLHRDGKRPDFLYANWPFRTVREVVEGMMVAAAGVEVVAVDSVMGADDDGEEATAVEDMAVYGKLFGEAEDGSDLWKGASLGSVASGARPRDSDHCEGRPCSGGCLCEKGKRERERWAVR